MNKTISTRKTIPTTLAIFLGCFVFYVIAHRLKHN